MQQQCKKLKLLKYDLVSLQCNYKYLATNHIQPVLNREHPSCDETRHFLAGNYIIIFNYLPKQ